MVGGKDSWFSDMCPAWPDNVAVGWTDNVGGYSGWDVTLGFGTPSVFVKSLGNGRQNQGYGWLDEDDYQPLVHYRGFHGVRESYLEISEEFRLYHQLCHLPSEHKFIKIEDDGTEKDAITYTTKPDQGFLSAEISRDLLDEFCLVKKMHLAVYFDVQRKNQKTLEEMGLDPKECLEIREGFIVLDRFWSDSMMSDGSLSIVRGKKLFPGLPRENNTPWLFNSEKKDYEKFIIGIDDDGQEIKAYCGPDREIRANGAFYKSVYFDRKVLDKYYADPDRYEIRDGNLYCAGLWGLRFDNNRNDGCVSAFLGDIGQMLSSKEQAYWKSFNIWPAQTGLSEAAYRRGVLGEFAEPNSPDFIFKYRFENFQKSYSSQSKWPLFEELEEEDQHNLSALRALTGNRQSEFDQQVLSLSKVLVDSLSEKEILRRYEESTGTPLTGTEGEERTIQKLEKLLEALGAPEPRESIQILRDIQGLRSASSAHRKGPSFKKLQERMGLKTKGLQQAFSEILLSASHLLHFLSQYLIAPAPSSNQRD